MATHIGIAGQQAPRIQYKVIDLVDAWYFKSMDRRAILQGRSDGDHATLAQNLKKTTAYGTLRCGLVLPVKSRIHCQILTTSQPCAYSLLSSNICSNSTAVKRADYVFKKYKTHKHVEQKRLSSKYSF